jgi:hypothetical protein
MFLVTMEIILYLIASGLMHMLIIWLNDVNYVNTLAQCALCAILIISLCHITLHFMLQVRTLFQYIFVVHLPHHRYLCSYPDQLCKLISYLYLPIHVSESYHVHYYTLLV